MFVAVVVSKPLRNAAGRKRIRTCQVHRLGDPEQALQLAEVDEPRPEPGEVVIGMRPQRSIFSTSFSAGASTRKGPNSPSRREVRSRVRSSIPAKAPTCKSAGPL